MHSEFQKRFGLTPGKLILVAVLGCMFVCVLVMQFFSGDSAATAKVKPRNNSPKIADKKPRDVSSRLKTPATITKANVKSKVNQTAETETRPSPWPSVSMQEAVSKNPFLMPAALRVPDAAELKAKEALAAQRIAEQKRLEEVEASKLKKQQEEMARLVATERHRLEVAQREKDARQESVTKKAEQLRLEQQQKAQRLAESKAAFEVKVAAEKKRVAAAIKQIQSTGIDMVMTSSTSRIAQINGKSYKVGDEFDDILVVEIRDDGGVILEPAE